MTGETPADRREAAATRRRWVTLAEVLAVAGVVIAALGLYNTWSERRASQAEKVAVQSNEEKAARRFDLRAIVDEKGSSLMFLRDERHAIEDAAVAFPTALGIGTKDALTGSIEREWLEAALLKATDGGPDERTGRLPVWITLRYSDGDATRTTEGIYDIIWKTEGRVLRGRTLRLEALRLRERGGSQARLDTLWARTKF